jgi:hypothetical protein
MLSRSMRLQRAGWPFAVGVLAGVVTVGAGCRREHPQREAARKEPPRVEVRTISQQALFAELTPVALQNCTLRRYGVPHDGGYLMCENLMGTATGGYSYGIDGRDDWGCEVSKQLKTTVHEYDCFNNIRPACDRGFLTFHDECVGGTATRVEGRPYDTVPNQLARNKDGGKHLIVKMDIEGDEWATLLATPDSVLDLIDQLVIEFHQRPGQPQPIADTITKLKEHFYVAHFHANNYGCSGGLEPFTSWANEVLLVNKKIGILDSSGRSPILPNTQDSPNNAEGPDCQPSFHPAK